MSRAQREREREEDGTIRLGVWSSRYFIHQITTQPSGLDTAAAAATGATGAGATVRM